MKCKFCHSAVAVFFGLMSVGAANASPFSIKMVADNDFAIFGGTVAGVNDLLYQNNNVWWDQISTLSTLTFTLPAADTMFYVLGMGGGGNENISGLINGVDMTSAAVSVSMSSDIQSYLGYNTSTVSAGTFNANLSDVQMAFSHLTWGAPIINTTDEVILAAAPNKIGFHFADSTAHLFAFSSRDVGVTPGPGTVPEPSSIALALIGLASLMGFRRRPRKTIGRGEERTATFA